MPPHYPRLVAILALTGAFTLGCGLSDGLVVDESTRVAFFLPPTIDVGERPAPAEGSGLQWREVDTGGKFEGVVVASWCSACEDFLSNRARRSSLIAATPNVFFVETEGALRVEQLARSEADAAELRAAQDAYGLQKGHLLPSYAAAIREGVMPIEYVPFFFRCENRHCEGYSADW